MLPSACSLGQHFQDPSHIFSLHGPPSCKCSCSCFYTKYCAAQCFQHNRHLAWNFKTLSVSSAWRLCGNYAPWLGWPTRSNNLLSLRCKISAFCSDYSFTRWLVTLFCLFENHTHGKTISRPINVDSFSSTL